MVLPLAAPSSVGRSVRAVGGAVGMLGAEILAYNKRVAAGEAAPASSNTPQSRAPEPPSLAGLHLSDPVSGERSLVSQSLPSGNHLSLHGRPPPKPRFRPSDPPRMDLSQLPILELPEPSPHSSSFLDVPPILDAGATREVAKEEEEDTGGT